MDYPYTISGSITSQKVDVKRLSSEIKTLALPGLENVIVDREKDSLIIRFENPLTSPQKTQLDTTIQNHSGDPIPILNCCTIPTWPDASNLPANHAPALVYCIAQAKFYLSNGTTWTQVF